MESLHRFVSRLEWTGAANGPAADYNAYSREHRLEFDHKPGFTASSAPGFLGDERLLNPEEMLVAALSSCQMLTYLAVMAKTRIPVIAYTDQAEGILEKAADGRMWVTKVVLKPTITVATGSDLQKARANIERAHANCFIANSVKTEVAIDPTFVEV